MTKRPSPKHQPPNFGDVNAVAKRIKTSNVIAENKEAIGNLLLTMGGTVLTDFVSWDSAGNLTVKPSDQIPDQKMHGLKKIKQTVTKDGVATLEVEIVDKTRVVQMLAKGAGLLEPPGDDDDDRPSILGINIKAPGNK